MSIGFPASRGDILASPADQVEHILVRHLAEIERRDGPGMIFFIAEQVIDVIAGTVPGPGIGDPEGLGERHGGTYQVSPFQADSAQVTEDSLRLIIHYAGDRADTLGLTISVADSLTVLAVLQTATKRAGIPLRISEYAMGVFVEQIGDRINGEGGYWLYTVNGDAIPKAVSACTVAPHDTIRFFFDER